MHPSRILQTPARTQNRPGADVGDTSNNEQSGWQAVFDQRRFVQLQPAQADSHAPAATATGSSPTDNFCVYLAGPPAPAASSAAAASAASSSDATAEPVPSPPPFVALLLHGGGHSSLAWACVTAHLKQSMHVLTFDLRGHGHTHTQNDNELSMSRLVSDVVGVVLSVYPRPPPLLVIGHSLGAAVGVHVAATKLLPVCGLCMIDLVEGTAVDSLVHMADIVASRPSAFSDHAAAVQWALRSGALRNPQSARFSMPDQLVESVLTHAERVRGAAHEDTHEAGVMPNPAVAAAMASAAPVRCYRWRTDLLASERYWSGWFAGLSALFLSCPAPKLLLLASADRLDPPLMVAQMQGKLQVDVVGNSGHSVQEDQPAETARRISGFAARHKFNLMAAVWAKTNAAAAAPRTTATTAQSSASGTVVAVSAANVVHSASCEQSLEPASVSQTHGVASSLRPPSPATAHSASTAAAPSQPSSSSSSSGRPARPPVPLFHE